jgi:hypothetical protein
LPPNDPKAVSALVALLAAGEHTSYVVAYSFTRTRADGATLPSSSFEARTPQLYVTRLGDTLTAVGNGRSFDCDRFSGKANCVERASGTTLPQSEVWKVAIATAPYDVWRIADTTIAGERTRCFALHSHTGKLLPDVGAAAEICFDDQGVPLRRRRFGDALDDWEATTVVHRVDVASLHPLLVGFEAASPTLGK